MPCGCARSNSSLKAASFWLGSHSIQRSCDRFDRLEPMTKARHRFTVLLQLPIREVPDAQLAYLPERRARELGADFVLAIVGRHQVEASCSSAWYSERQVQEPHDAGIDRGGVLNLESPGDVFVRFLEP